MAKRRRINLKFIVICVLALVFAGGVALVLRRTVFRPNPDRYLAMAKDNIAKSDWESAARNLSTVIRYARAPDPTIWLMLADAYQHQTVKDFADYNRQYLMCLDKALEVDNKYLPALRLKLDYQMDLIQLLNMRKADSYAQLTTLADKVLANDPNDHRAQYITAYAVLDQRLNGIQIDPKRLDTAEQQMQALLTSDPTNAEVPFVLAKWQMFKVWEQDRLGNSQQARQLFDQTDQDIVKWTATRKDNALMHLRMGEMLLTMADTYPSLVNKAATTKSRAAEPLPGGTNASPLLTAIRQKRSELLKRAFSELETASTLAKKDDPHYVEIQSFYALQLERPIGLIDLDMSRQDLEKTIKGSNAKAEGIYRGLLKYDPGERIVRVKFAEFLTRNLNNRQEALKVLEDPTPPTAAWTGVKGFLAKSAEIQTAINLAATRLDLVDFAGNKADREALLKSAQGDFDKLVNVLGESAWQTQEVKGRLQLLKGDPMAATHSFDRAMQDFKGDADDLGSLKYLQARAFLATNQTGEAKALLREVVGISPGNLLARAQLAELLMNEGNVKGTPPKFEDGAVAQVDALERMYAADNPIVLRLRIRTLDRDKDAKQFTALWAQIPEKSPEERFDKARFAASMNWRDEAIRLLESIRTDKPDSLEVVQPLVQLYMEQNAKDKAVAVLDGAIAKNPQNKSLEYAKQTILNPTEAMEDRQKSIEKMTDPLKKEFAWVDYYRDQGDEKQMTQHVLELQKLAPDNPSVITAMFELSLVQKNWDQANAYLERISKRNLDNVDGQMYRVRLAVAQGNLDQAQEIASGLTKSQSGFAQSWVLLGQTLQARQKYDEAIGAYNEAINRQTQNLDALRGLIDCSYALNQPGRASDPARGIRASGAKQYIELAQKVYPYSAQFKEMALRWEMTFGDPELAITPRAQVVKDHPESPGAWFDLAMAYYAAGEPRQTDVPQKSISQDDVAIDETNLTPQSEKYFQKCRDTLSEAAKKFPDDSRFTGPLINVLLRLKDVDQAEKTLTALLDRPEYKGKPEVPNTLADFYIRVKKLDKAEKVLRDALVTDPKNESIEARLAGILQQQGRIDEALKVLEANDTNEYILRQRLNLLVTSTRIEDADRMVNALMAKDPNSMFYLRLRANVDLAMGKIDACRAEIAKLLAADPNDIDGLFLRARTQLADPRGDLAQAITDLNHVVDLQPGLMQAREQLAEAYFKRGMTGDSIRVLQGILQQQPNDKASRLRLLNLYCTVNPPRWFDAENLFKDSRTNPLFAGDPDFMHAEAQMWMSRKEPNKALELMKAAIKQQPNNLLYLNTYLGVLADHKDYDDLLNESDRITKSYPKIWWAYHYRAIAKIRGQNDRKAALKDFVTALEMAMSVRDQNGAGIVASAINTEIGPTQARAVLNGLTGLDAHWQLVVSSMLAQIGDNTDALAMIDKVLVAPDLTTSDRTDALKIGGAMYMSSENIPKAIEYYRRLIKELPDDFEALNNVAYLLLEPGPANNPAEALKYSQHVLDLTRQQNATDAMPLVMDTYAWALINCNKLDEGVTNLKQALEKRKFPEAYFHLGEAYLKYQPPKLLEAERAFLDARDALDTARRENQNVDKTLQGKIEQELDRVKQLKK